MDFYISICILSQMNTINKLTASYQVKTSHDIREVSLQRHCFLHNSSHYSCIYSPEIYTVLKAMIISEKLCVIQTY